MGKLIDLTGQRFGRLVVLERAGHSSSNDVLWMCQCDCGTRKIINGRSLRRGKTLSCGCYMREIVGRIHRIHGQYKSRLYRIWKGMLARCNIPSATSYSNYGDRGVNVAKEWFEFGNFEKWAHSSGYTDDLTLDRIDTNGNYSPDNCHWVNRLRQGNNSRRNVLLTFNGEQRTTSEWAREVGINYETIRSRLLRGWPIERALTEPVKHSKRK